MPDNSPPFFTDMERGCPKGNDLLRIIHQLNSQLTLKSGGLNCIPLTFSGLRKTAEEAFWKQVLSVSHRSWYIHTCSPWGFDLNTQLLLKSQRLAVDPFIYVGLQPSKQPGLNPDLRCALCSCFPGMLFPRWKDVLKPA